jgi:2-iminobutanoate/2-iminopropanoate deaminase
LDPDTGRLVGGGVAAQTRRALANLEAILDAAGSSMDQVLRTTVYLTDMADFQAMNEVYALAFGSEPPARSTVSVVALPVTARVGIDAIARTGG